MTLHVALQYERAASYKQKGWWSWCTCCHQHLQSKWPIASLLILINQWWSWKLCWHSTGKPSNSHNCLNAAPSFPLSISYMCASDLPKYYCSHTTAENQRNLVFSVFAFTGKTTRKRRWLWSSTSSYPHHSLPWNFLSDKTSFLHKLAKHFDIGGYRISARTQIFQASTPFPHMVHTLQNLAFFPLWSPTSSYNIEHKSSEMWFPRGLGVMAKSNQKRSFL